MSKLARRSGALAVSTLLTLAVSGALWAQEAPATAPETLIAPATMPIPATLPGISQTDTMTFNFVEAPLSAVLTEMSQRFGFIILTTPGTPIPGRITMTSQQPLNAREAISLMNSVLNTQQLATLETSTGGQTPRTILRVVTTAEAKKAQIPVISGSDSKDIEITDTLRTQIIPLKNIDAQRLRTDLGPLMSADADIAANVASNSIIVTDTAAKIHRLVEIIQYLDHTPIIQTIMDKKQLQYSSAVDAAKLINNLYSPTNVGPVTPGGGGGGGGGGRGGGGSGGRGGFGGGGGGTPGVPGGTSDYARTARIYADSDARTNTVVVTGPPDLVKAALDLLSELDKDPALLNDSVFFVYPLKNAQSANLELVLNRVFGTGSTSGFGSTTANRGTTTTGTRSGTTSGFGSATTGGRGGTTGRSSTSGRSGAGGFGSTSSGGAFGSASSGGAFGSTNRGTTATSGRSTTGSGSGALSGDVFVVANPDTNSLLVTTTGKLEKQVREILDKLDRPVPQVLIKVLIAEVTHNNSDDIGFEFSGSDLRINGNGITAGTNVITGSAALAGGATGGLKIGLVENQINATLQALAKQSKLDVLSRPYILVQDNQEAYMIIGQEIPYITNSQITTDGNTINSVQYRQVGVILDVIPHINPEGLVTLDVAPQVSQLDSGSGVPISSNVSAPTFTIRQAQSRVAIKNGETIVIGGLMQDQKTQQIDKIPVLGDIPYLGMLFKRTQNLKSKTELLIFLTPHVALSPDVLDSMSKEEVKTLKLVPTAVQPGIYDDHRKGMDQGATSTQPAESLRIEGGQLINPK